jgi:Family of unknown function (DUF6328)
VRGVPESEDERLDRELIELLNELRVALPGVQVLFGFLLVVPFSARWTRVTDLQRDVYFVTLLLTAAATAFLIAPSANHRLRFRKGDKPFLVTSGSRSALIGLAFLSLALTGAVLLVADVLFGTLGSSLAAAATFVAITGLWFAVPLARALADEGRSRRLERGGAGPSGGIGTDRDATRGPPV